MKCQRNATENNSELAKTSTTLYHQMLSLKGKARSGVRNIVSDDKCQCTLSAYKLLHIQRFKLKAV